MGREQQPCPIFTFPAWRRIAYNSLRHRQKRRFTENSRVPNDAQKTLTLPHASALRMKAIPALTPNTFSRAAQHRGSCPIKAKHGTACSREMIHAYDGLVWREPRDYFWKPDSRRHVYLFSQLFTAPRQFTRESVGHAHGKMGAGNGLHLRLDCTVVRRPLFCNPFH